MADKPLIFDYQFPELVDFAKENGLPQYRADQIWHGIYSQLWKTPEEFTTLPKKVVNLLNENIAFEGITPVTSVQSSDGHTLKTLFRLRDGNNIETVLMEYDTRNTLCISSQAGCAMNCSFCATGQMGFFRNLTPGEIVEQVIYFARVLQARDEPVTNIVFMGMGEPFHNYNNVMTAINILNQHEGFNLGARRFTISTVGLIPGIERFTQENSQVNLAISLHAATDELRASMIPINNRYPIEDLIAACKRYVEHTNRRITFEWALINQVNDTPEQAQELIRLLKGMLCHVNVIPLNPTAGFDGQKSKKGRVYQFQSILQDHGIPCTVRMRRGIDIQAGCGQLANKVNQQEGSFDLPEQNVPPST